MLLRIVLACVGCVVLCVFVVVLFVGVWVVRLGWCVCWCVGWLVGEFVVFVTLSLVLIGLALVFACSLSISALGLIVDLFWWLFVG